MAARKWTTEQRERQAALIRTWAPWATSTGPKTPKGKAVSSKNAVSYSLRELLREMTRTNRALVTYIKGMGPPPSYDQSTMDKLLDDVEKAVMAPTTTRTEPQPCAREPVKTIPFMAQTPSASKKSVIESRQQEYAECQRRLARCG